MKNSKTLFLVQFGILLAIEAIFCFTPLGSLPLFGAVVATVAMIPVIITALLFGPRAGSLMGAFAGLFSLMVWTFTPPSPLTAFIFTPFYTLGEIQGNFGSLLICFLPRILVGTVAGLSYRWFSKIFPKKDVLSLSLSAALASLTNTFGFLIGIWLFFAPQVSSVAGSSILVFAVGIILANGIPEAIVSAFAAAAVCTPVKMVLGKR